MNDKEIIYDSPPYDKMKMVDLSAESEDMQWAILDYHNQSFVLNNIVDNMVFTREGHANFLAKYPTMQRKQYIVYYDGKAIGKVSFTPLENGEYESMGYYLFHEEDLHKHFGMLMVTFCYHYLFDQKKAKKLKYSALKGNKASQRISLRLGCKIVREDGEKVYLECQRDDYEEHIADVDKYLAAYFR
ncbi:Acetyltransferase (GNAT) domain-containing protein [Selenomonas ruminantium]|uniref:Acetyltransferase (GNAT) domain-containing protein n=1 Tax=Selenomonas ruminantium TaxID=971 RepID=A0A1I3EGZ8_SELRU|nr:GNAT family N-acetyltransferase [Selenomonas ruminantium]SFH98239.1 Acetyltransferase (GNAT) domain-containing protein [Selenomonas ruminantium]